MAYFPFFVDIKGKDCLIVGGGKVALRKVEKLLPYGPVIHVIATEFQEGFSRLNNVRLNRGRFAPALLEGMAFVIAATDDVRLNHQIAELCREKKIPINVVDDREYCSFLFPALVKRGDLSVGISTGGASPSAAIYLKEQLQQLLPGRFDEILLFLDSVRAAVKASFPQEKDRAAVLRELFLLCMERGEPIGLDEFNDFLEERRLSRNG